tara:strand:- start:321 stop:596 length:276 start_codon:yes stop_codon:yes gene_type:complete
MNLISMLFVFLGVCVVVIAGITMYLDRRKPRDVNDSEPAETQEKKQAGISESSVKNTNSSTAKVIKTAIPFMASGFTLWVFASFIANHDSK